jgi:hypothetical protein
MEDRFLIFAGIVAVVAIVLSMLYSRVERNNELRTPRVRRGAGNVLLGLQGFIAPSAEYVVQAQNVEQKEEEDDNGLGGDREADESLVRADLAESLSRTPVDPEEVRRHLAAASRLGLDWKALFDQAIADELRERPFRAPSLPPARRVAPRE